jgi:hypothetical protein
VFVGHFGLALGGKSALPRVSLGTLFLSVQLADFLWPVLLLLDLEQVRIVPNLMAASQLDFVRYPISHSLLALLLWGLLFGAVYGIAKRSRAGAILLAAGVVSHWVLDFVTHRPDLPIVPGGRRYGLGLWDSVPGTLLVEGGLYAAGIGLHLKATRARDARGTWTLWTLLVVLAALWIAALFGPPPPGEKALALTALLGWLFVPWGYWIDRHRVVGFEDEHLSGGRNRAR